MKLGKHQFKVGQQVKLPGRQYRFTGYGYKNKFMWDVAGTVEELGWSKPLNTRERIGWTERAADGSRRAIYNTEPVQYPMYKVNGNWYTNQQVSK